MAPPHNSAKDDKGRTHSKRWLSVGLSDPSTEQGGGPKRRCSAQPSHCPPSPPRISEKRLGNQLPSGNRKGSPALQSHPCHCAGKPRGSGGETGSARSRAGAQLAAAAELVGHSAWGGGARERQAGEPEAYFPGKKLSASPLCRTLPTALILTPLPSSRSGQSPAVAPSSASFGRHSAARLRSRQQPPLTERWAQPTSHQTPRSRRRPIGAAAGARRSRVT